MCVCVCVCVSVCVCECVCVCVCVCLAEHFSCVGSFAYFPLIKYMYTLVHSAQCNIIF